MSKIDVVIATANCYMTAAPNDGYVNQLIREDMYIVEALEKMGIHAIRRGWDDPQFDWLSTQAVIIRTTWNYAQHFPQFRTWLAHVAAQCQLFNPLDVIRWNIEKSYLRDLENRGVHAVTTVYASRDEKLETVMDGHGWEEVVIKPVVSADAAHTYRIHRKDVAQYQVIWQKLQQEREMMIQPFQRQIAEKGEVSCIVIGNHFSHAVRKIPKNGDFRVQDSHGGSVVTYQPDADEMAFAEQAIAASPWPTLYARADFVRDNEGRLAIMELELIEPELFFRFRPQAATELAEAVQQKLGRSA